MKTDTGIAPKLLDQRVETPSHGSGPAKEVLHEFVETSVVGDGGIDAIVSPSGAGKVDDSIGDVSDVGDAHVDREKVGAHKDGAKPGVVVQEELQPNGDLSIVETDISVNDEVIVGTGDRLWYLAMTSADVIPMREIRPDETCGALAELDTTKEEECCKGRKGGFGKKSEHEYANGGGYCSFMKRLCAHRRS